MPRITFTTPPVANHFKIGGFTVYTQNGHYYAKRNSGKGIVKFYDLGLPNLSFLLSAALWPFATIDQIQHWIAYKNNEGIHKSARNAVIKNNLQAIHHYLPGIDPIMDISLPAEYPEYPTCFYAHYDENIDNIVYEWNDIYMDETYIALGLLNITSRTNKLTPKYRIKNAALAADLTENIPGSSFSAGAKLWASIRACNERGEVSPWCLGIEIDIPKKPKANFHCTPTSGNDPLTVQFTDESTGTIRGRLWDFGDGMQSGETNPSHIFTGAWEYFTISLTCFGPGQSKHTKTRIGYIHLTSEEKRHWLFIVDYWNSRIIIRSPFFLDYIDKFGEQGEDPGQLWYPTGIAVYGDYMWIYDTYNLRVQCFGIPSFSLVNIMEEMTFGYGLAVDLWNIWILNQWGPYIMVRKKDTYDYVTDIWPDEGGIGDFLTPTGCCIDGDYFYMLDDWFHCMIIWEKSESIALYRIETGSSPGIIIENPRSCAVDSTYIYITQYRDSAHECLVLLKHDRSLVTTFPLAGPKFHDDTYGISSDDTYLYICLTGNHQISKYRISDFAFIGAEGSYNGGDEQFKGPCGNALWNEE